jgi:hypothetical protein
MGDIRTGKSPQTNAAQLRIGKLGRFHLDHPISFYNDDAPLRNLISFVFKNPMSKIE